MTEKTKEELKRERLREIALRVIKDHKRNTRKKPAT